MKKTFKLFVPIVALVLILTACGEKKEEAIIDKPVFKIGMIYPLSVAAGSVGEDAKAAVKFFEQKAVADKFKYEFVWEDNQLNAARSASLAHKVIDVDKVDAIITIGSSNANAVAPIAEKGQVLHFAIANTPEASLGDYNFAMATHLDIEAQKLLQELKNRGYKKVALVTQTQAFNIAASNEIRKMAADYGVELISDNTINNGERDFRALAVKIMADKPEIVIANLYVPEISVFVKQLKNQAPEVKLTAIEAFSFPEDKSLLEGYWFVDQAFPTAEFIKSVEEITEKNVGNYAENVYTSLELMRESLNENGNDKAKMIEFLQSGKTFDTVLGKVAMDKTGRLESEASIKIIKNGQAMLVED